MQFTIKRLTSACARRRLTGASAGHGVPQQEPEPPCGASGARAVGGAAPARAARALRSAQLQPRLAHQPHQQIRRQKRCARHNPGLVFRRSFAICLTKL